MFGDYGSAAMKQIGNRLTGNSEGNLSVKDKIAKEKFISDFIGRASTNLNSAIQSGLVDPEMQSGAPDSEEPQQDVTPDATSQQSSTSQQPATSTAPKTPAEIQKEKLAAAAKVAQDQMANSPAPTQQTKMTPQQTAALKGRLKAGAAPTSGQSGFKNYVGGSGQVQRESRYAKLDYILESIININEAPEAQSISEYLENMFNQYLGIPITDPKAKAQIKTLADQAQASYPKMTNALTQMANLGFAISYSQGTGATQGASATTSQPASALDAIKAGVQQGMGSDASASTSISASPTTATTPGASEQGTTAYDQVMALVDKLSTEEKQKLIATLQEPASGGEGSFDQMQKQLQEPKTTANPLDNRQQKLNTNKVKAGNKGAPTTAEYDKFDKLAQQALAKQV
jgi:hypothetical protein